MPVVKINDTEIEVQAGLTVLQACEQAGVEIPRFCYHERLSIAGNCRMCLVQIEGGPPKPAASCAIPVAEGMVVHTDTPMVKKAREGVMEFLLANHPLDCPICDQGGECDLQDQAMAYGRGGSRFDEFKRAVKDKNMGPLIKTHMTRCIHCTRCIRFAREIAGVDELGAIGRGEHMEVTTYVGKAVTSELSGNMIDLCPVGALTSKPFAFKARNWELGKFESIDVLDAVGSNIRIDVKGREVMRILPILNEEINEEWISDKTRFSYDGLKLQRLDKPYIRKNGRLSNVNWDEAFKNFAQKISEFKPEEIAVITGPMVDVETLTILKELTQNMGIKNYDGRGEGIDFEVQTRADYLFNTTILGIERADVCLLIGANPRFEASMIGARLRKRYLNGGFKIASIGQIDDQTYPVDIISENVNILNDILNETHEFANILKSADHPMIIIGETALKSENGNIIHKLCKKIAQKYNIVQENWNGFNILHKAASRTGAFEVGFKPDIGGFNTKEIIENITNGKIKFLYLIGEDELEIPNVNDLFIVYQGHHGDKSAHRANIIFPATAYTEKNSTYVNLEGRVQKTIQATPPIGLAKDDWEIILNISKYLEKKLTVENAGDIRNKIQEISPIFANVGKVLKAEWEDNSENLEINISENINSKVDNFYMTDPISRASKIMTQCANEIRANKEVVNG